MSSDKIPFAIAFDRCQSTVDYRFFSPFWAIEEFFNFRKRQQHLQDIQTLRSFGLDIIKKRRSDTQENESPDILTYFMKIKSDDGSKFTDKQLCDYVLNFIIAGRDTTAQALSWCIYEVSRHPEVEKKLLEEIYEFVGMDDISYEKIKEMKYANAVFNETLRLYPSVPKNIKEARVNEVLPNGTKVKKGCMVVWSPYIMGRTEAIWGPDACEFKPERWLNMTKPVSASEYPVFHAGPRTCLGKSLAELEGVFVLVSLLREFKITVCKDQIITYANSLTLPMKYGIKCQVEKR
jgi:fatty acid omega-hydroxylase